MFTLVAAILRKSGWLLLSFVIVLGLLVVAADLPAKLRDAWRQAANLRTVGGALSGKTQAFEEDARARAAGIASGASM